LGAYPNSDHVLGDLFAETHACIEAFGDNVRKACVRINLHVDVRIVDQEPVDHRP
jgi:uncharacterized protein (UPF0218 family)